MCSILWRIKQGDVSFCPSNQYGTTTCFLVIVHSEHEGAFKFYVFLLCMALVSIVYRVLPSGGCYGEDSDTVQGLQNECVVAGTLKTADIFIDSQ